MSKFPVVKFKVKNTKCVGTKNCLRIGNKSFNRMQIAALINSANIWLEQK